MTVWARIAGVVAAALFVVGAVSGIACAQEGAPAGDAAAPQRVTVHLADGTTLSGNLEGFSSGVYRIVVEGETREIPAAQVREVVPQMLENPAVGRLEGRWQGEWRSSRYSVSGGIHVGFTRGMGGAWNLELAVEDTPITLAVPLRETTEGLQGELVGISVRVSLREGGVVTIHVEHPTAGATVDAEGTLAGETLSGMYRWGGVSEDFGTFSLERQAADAAPPLPPVPDTDPRSDK